MKNKESRNSVQSGASRGWVHFSATGTICVHLLMWCNFDIRSTAFATDVSSYIPIQHNKMPLCKDAVAMLLPFPILSHCVIATSVASSSV